MKSLWLISTLVVLATAEIIGVAPENQYLYKPAEDGTWRCLSDPNIVLSADQINDNFCDCPDGSDEPGTNACEFTDDLPKWFYCANEGHIPKYIENYKVNDGVCDYDICCDGSDEYASGKCENKCGEVKNQYDEFVSAKEKAIETALGVKNELVEKATEAKLALVGQIGKLKEKLSVDGSELEKLILDLQTAEEADESDESSESSWQPLVDELNGFVETAENKFSEVYENSKENLKKVSQLEEMLSALVKNYNPNFNDPSVKQCVKFFEEYMSNKKEEEKSVDLGQILQPIRNFGSELASKLGAIDLSPNSAVSIIPTFGNMVHYYYEQMISGFKPAETLNVLEKPRKVSLKAVGKLRESIESLQKKINSNKAEVSIYEENMQKSYGARDILRAVEGEWVTKQIGEYTYKLGFLDAIYQDNTLVGRFSGYDEGALRYTEGSRCWNGPLRSAIVETVCGPKHDLLSVSEPEKCQYKFVLETPIACTEMSTEEIAAQFQIDVSKLR